jgi:hypothetical protein
MVYADEVFLVNAILDYVLLLAAAKLCGTAARRWRLALAAALGGVYAALAAIFPFWGNALCKAGVGVGLAAVSFGVRRLARRAAAPSRATRALRARQQQQHTTHRIATTTGTSTPRVITAM